jgi:hypothetical protein
MSKSQYLAQALQSMAADPGVQAPAGPDLAGMHKQAEAKRAWEAANPGKNYMAEGLKQMGANIQAAPGRIAGAPQAALGGLLSMGQAMRP